MPELDKFLSQLSKFNGAVDESKNTKQAYKAKQQKVINFLEQELQRLTKSLHDDNPLKDNIKVVVKRIQKSIKSIHEKTDRLTERMKLQEAFSERLIIIIYGKVNAGKSSFTNYLTGLVAQKLAVTPKHFIFEKGAKKPLLSESFKEGCTETTVEIQGVEIGNLVLLDSPGLHSINEENGALAKDFTDSADLILWLTWSGSPGQVQELTSLQSELEKKKVLIPVITKSDRFDEDEVDGELVKVLTMKEESVMADQQEDVHSRTLTLFKEKGFPSDLLRPSCSVSVYYAKENAGQDGILIDSGIEAVFKKINDVYQEILDAKLHSVERQTKNHLQDIRSEFTTLKPIMSDTLQLIVDKENDLKSISRGITEQLLLDSKLALPSLIESAIENNDSDRLAAKQLLISNVEQMIQEKLGTLVNEELVSIFKSLATSASRHITTDIKIDAEFEDQTIHYSQSEGKVGAAATTGAATLAGMAIGSMVAPGIGTVIGGAIGGFFGGAAGSYAFVKETEVTEVIGVNKDKIEREIYQAIEKTVPDIVQQVVGQLLKHLNPLAKTLNNIEQHLYKF